MHSDVQQGSYPLALENFCHAYIYIYALLFVAHEYFSGSNIERFSCRRKTNDLHAKSKGKGEEKYAKENFYGDLCYASRSVLPKL